MAAKSLEQVYKDHVGKVSDRWWSYLAEYERAFRELREKPISLLEIGVQNGGSLEIWSEYFPNAVKLVGCDVNPDCARLTFDDPRIVVLVGDASSEATAAQVLATSPAFDIVIDDGSHTSGDIATAFARYFPRVNDGGVFAAEDMHCSYWKEFDGGLFDPLSAISFFKRLADVIAHEHWGVQKPATDVMLPFFEKYGFELTAEQLSHVHSVEFVNSLCFVRKENPDRNSLGTRFVAGSLEPVMPGHHRNHGTRHYALDQSRNELASLTPRTDKVKALMRRGVAGVKRRLFS